MWWLHSWANLGSCHERCARGRARGSFTRPNPSVRSQRERPRCAGMEFDAAADRLGDFGFGAHLAGEVASAIARGLVVDTDPAPGDEVAAGVRWADPQLRSARDFPEPAEVGRPGPRTTPHIHPATADVAVKSRLASRPRVDHPSPK